MLIGRTGNYRITDALVTDTTNRFSSAAEHLRSLADIMKEGEQNNKKVMAKLALEKKSRDSIKNQRRREQQRIDAKFARRRR